MNRLITADNPPDRNIKISLKNLFHYYGDKEDRVPALKDINFEIYDHEFVAFAGPSGCGKSSLLNIMSGLIKPSSGEVYIDGKPSKGINKKIGYISQGDSLLPWRTVLKNVEFGLEIRGVPKKTRRDTASELIERAGLGGFENRFPHELSGGMKKRADIIRVLAIDPDVIFMDEPFGALDVFTKENLQEYILEIWQKTKKTIVFITHDLSEAVTLADRVFLMTARPALIKNIYAIPLPRPRDPLEIRFNEEFIELNRIIWEDLRDEVKLAGKQEHDQQNA